MTSSNFLKDVSQQLNIRQDKDESCENWKARLFYSMAGRWALASLWDKEDSTKTISKEHFNSKINEILQACISLYPQNGFLIEKNSEDEFITCYEKDIYKIYSDTGYFYHSSKRLKPVVFSCSQLNNVQLIRGAAPGETLCMSGLGLYKCTSETKNNEFTPETQFCLQKMPLIEWFKLFLQNVSWKETSISDDAEYLRTKPPYSHGYWQKNLVKDKEISLARYGEKGCEIYYLYRWYDESFQYAQLPAWQIRDGEYLRIAASILKKHGTLPDIEIQTGSSLVKIELGYLLPSEEENFFKLYSWPLCFKNKQSNFNRTMSIEVYPLFKNILEKIGYQFREV